MTGAAAVLTLPFPPSKCTHPPSAPRTEASGKAAARAEPPCDRTEFVDASAPLRVAGLDLLCPAAVLSSAALGESAPQQLCIATPVAAVLHPPAEMPSPRKPAEPKEVGLPMSSTATDTSEAASEVDADVSEFEIDPSFVRQLKRQLEKEVYRNNQLTAQLKRQTKLNEQLVSAHCHGSPHLGGHVHWGRSDGYSTL